MGTRKSFPHTSSKYTHTHTHTHTQTDIEIQTVGWPGCYPPAYSVAERGVCFQRRPFVSQFVCPHDNFGTIKRRIMKLGG